MEGLLDLVVKFLNSDFTQASLAVYEMGGAIKAITDKFKNRDDSLEWETLYCFDNALAEFCSNYKIEYDQNAIWETCILDANKIQNIDCECIQYHILKKAIGVDDLTESQKKYWKHCIDKIIAERNLTILSSYLTRIHERDDRNVIPRVLTELAPRPPIDSQLISRRDEQEEILRFIEDKKKLVLVNGLGGVGKSTVCKELFYLLHQDKSRCVAWVNYNGQSLYNDFVEQFYYPKMLTERKERIRFFIQNEIEEDAIIFVDNLNVREVEEPFIKVLECAGCNVICTSRISDYQYFEIVPVNLFETNKCIQLFKSYAGINEEDLKFNEIIEKIVQKVGHHTLTIEILGKIAAAEELTPQNIITRLESEGIDLEGIAEVDLKEDTLVGHLCKIFPIDRLNKNQKYILAHFANCPLEQIPKAIREWIGLQNNYNINYLKKYGWFIENRQSYYMHPIIKEVVKRIYQLDFKDYYVLLNSLEKLTHYNRNNGVKDALPYYSYIKTILGNVSDIIIPETAWLSFNFAVMEEEMGNYQQAIVYFKKAFNIWDNSKMRQICPESFIYAKKANIQVQIGSCYYYIGDIQSAKDWYDRASEIKDKHFDKELNAQLFSNYALLYQKDYKEAIKYGKPIAYIKRNLTKALIYFKQTITEFRKLGKKDEFVAIAMRNLGGIYMDLGRYQQAINYNRKALEIREAFLPSDSPNRERNYNDLGLAFLNLAKESPKLSSQRVKYKIAYNYFQLCHAICVENTRKRINKVNLEDLEKHMIICKDQLEILHIGNGNRNICK